MSSLGECVGTSGTPRLGRSLVRRRPAIKPLDGTTHPFENRGKGGAPLGSVSTGKEVQPSSEAGGGVNGLGDGEAQVLVGVHRRVVDADLVVQVGSGGAAAEADVADGVAAAHALAGGHGEGGQVPEAGGGAVAVVDDHHAAVSAEEFGADDQA